LGAGDLHDTSYDSTKVSIPLVTHQRDKPKDIDGNCLYWVSVYSSHTFEESLKSDNVILIGSIVLAAAFAILACIFGLYDGIVRHRNLKVVMEAAKSNAIISSLFPTQVRDRLFAEKSDNVVPLTTAPKAKLKNMLNSGTYIEADVANDANDLMYESKPIADLFPETTILFADIAGFTAWSSVREPSQVFVLLETLYRAFDIIAKKRRVFKVETIGDCYVAVTGLPEPRKDHAVAMARFSRDCMVRMRSLCKQLEVTLGPDTGDLSMRMGIHSGPVTAGVLRGERSRFQLFGDTMNTAARMEHTGQRDKIQVSQETADLLIAAGKTNWLSKREDGTWLAKQMSD
jgi:class 3 adenylate cyclase